jgi:hypothetical protein
MTGVWMALGGGLIVLLLVVGALLPRPYGEYQLIDFNTSGSKDRNASRYAVLREGAGQGEGRPSSDKGSRTKDAQPGSGNQADDKQGEKGNGKSPGGQSGQGGKGSAQQGDGQAGAKDGKSGRQDSSQGNSRSGNKSGEDQKGQTNDQRSTQNDADSRNRREEQKNEQTGGRKPGQDAGSGSDAAPSSSNSISLPDNPVSQVLQKLGWLGTILKWIVFGVVGLVVLFFVLRSGLNFLANFTSWARQLVDALRAWWQGLFGPGETESDTETDEPARVPKPRPFASFANPFLDGRADHLSPEALVRYSFEALEAWSWEHGLGRRPEETPLEFAQQLCAEKPELEAEVRSLAGLYIRLAYARSSLTPACLGLLKRFWQRLGTIEEKPVSV